MTEDVKIVEEIMKQLKIESYDENVIPFLIEFMSGRSFQFVLIQRVKAKDP